MLRSLAATTFLVAILSSLNFVACATADVPSAAPVDATTRTTEDEVRRVVALLDYVSSDYEAAIASNDPTEYAEQVSFVRDANERVAHLSGERRPEVSSALAQLSALVARRAAPAEIASACQLARDALLAAYPVRLAPRQPPSRIEAAATFATTCAPCHGSRGGGDGPAAAGLHPPPRSFRDAQTMLDMSPVRAFAALTDGVRGTAMPSFASTLRERERWNLAFYVVAMRFDAEPPTGAAITTRIAALRDLERLATSSDRELRGAIAQAGVPDGDRDAALAELRAVAPFAEPNAQLTTMRRGLVGVRAAYARGDRDGARAALDDAYLDGFEPLEGKLRVSAPELTASIEEHVLALRDRIASGVSTADLSADLDALDARLDAVEARLGGGSAAATIFLASFVIVLREGVESFLLIALLLGLATRAGGPNDRRAVHAGWMSALAAGAVTWLASGLVERIGGAHRELVEGVVALFAVVVLLYAGHFVLARLDAQRRIAALKRRFAEVSARRRFAILFSLGFVALYREAFEVVLFLRAIVLGEEGGGAMLGLGVAAGVLACVVAAVLMRRFGRRLAPGVVLNLGGALLCVLAVVLAGKGVRSLQEAGAIRVDAFAGPRIDWLGLYPTRETLLAQIAAIIAIAVVALVGTRRQRRPDGGAAHA